MGNIDHFWRYLITRLDMLESVEYVNHHHGEDLEGGLSDKEKGLSWVIVALNCGDDLKQAFM